MTCFLYFPISNTWKWLNRPLLVPCLLRDCKHFPSSWWCGFLIWFGWSAKKEESLTQNSRIFVSHDSCWTEGNFILVLRQDQLSACSQQWTGNILGLLFSTCSFSISGAKQKKSNAVSTSTLLQKKSKLIGEHTSNLTESIPKAHNERTVKPVICPEVFKLYLIIFTSLNFFASNNQQCILLAPRQCFQL